MKVKELRRKIEKAPDDAVVLIEADGSFKLYEVLRVSSEKVDHAKRDSGLMKSSPHYRRRADDRPNDRLDYETTDAVVII
jgi:hypothetical protein